MYSQGSQGPVGLSAASLPVTRPPNHTDFLSALRACHTLSVHCLPLCVSLLRVPFLPVLPTTKSEMIA